MEQPNRENREEPPAAKVGGRKLIAIIIAVVVVLVALAVAAIYYLGQGSPCATPASLAGAHPENSKASPSDASPASMVRATIGVGRAITQVGTITVGFSISLTGTFNVEGTNSLNGIKTAAQWINSHGGVTVQGSTYNVSLDFYDDQSNSGNIVQLYTKIVTQDGAEFLLAPYSSGLTTAAAPIADQYDRVMLSHGGSADTILTSTNRRNLLEVLSPASSYLKGAVDWIQANHPSDRIAALYASDSFSTPATRSAVAYPQSLGLEWLGPTPTEFTQLYGTVTSGGSPSYHAAEAGASLFVLADAIQKANSLNTTAVRTTLGTMHIMTFFGEFQINSKGLQTAHSMVLVQWQAGSLKLVQPANVAESSVQYPYTGS